MKLPTHIHIPPILASKTLLSGVFLVGVGVYCLATGDVAHGIGDVAIGLGLVGLRSKVQPVIDALKGLGVPVVDVPYVPDPRDVVIPEPTPPPAAAPMTCPAAPPRR